MSIINATVESFENDIKEGVSLVDFYADWCGPCQLLGPILEEASTETDGKIIKVDVDKAQEIAGKFGVMSIPTMILFKDGEPVEKHVGVLQKEQIIEWIAGVK